MKTLVKIEKRDNTIGFRTVSKDGRRFRYRNSSRTFLITREGIEELFAENCLVEKDLHSFVSCVIYDGKITMEFYWLSESGSQIIGEKETVIISLDKFKNFFYDEGVKVTDLLSIEENSPAVIKVRAPKSMGYIMKDKLLKRKFIKFLRDNFQWYRGDEILLYDDSPEGSFYFVEMKNGRRGICGGLILHNRDSEKSYFQIHT